MLMSAGGTANAAGVHASARTAGKTAFHLRMNLRALCIWNFLHGVKRSLATTGKSLAAATAFA
jgi:hypothetical protein